MKEHLIYFNNLALSMSRESLACKFGVSVPTINRWYSSDDIPAHAQRIIDLLILLEAKEDECRSLLFKHNSLYQQVQNYTTALADLSRAVE